MSTPTTQRISEPAAPDIHEVDYPAINCRAGIFAGVLQRKWGIGMAPLFLRLPIAPCDVVEPAERGEIAGSTFGSFQDETWTGLFGARFITWHPASRAELNRTLDEALAAHGYVLAAHDGYGNPHAADKYQHRHMRHNALLYGRTADGGYLTADRGYCYTLDGETMWRCMEEDSTAFVAITGAAANQDEPAALLALGLDRLSRALQSPLDDDHIARLAVVTAMDLADANRWRQTHFYLTGVGRSRALFAQALRDPYTADGLCGRLQAAELADLLDRAADAWVLAGRLVYKRMVAGRTVGVPDLAVRVKAAQTADARALQALGVIAVPRPDERRQ